MFGILRSKLGLLSVSKSSMYLTVHVCLTSLASLWLSFS